MSKIETAALALALLVATSVAAVARNDQVGQGQWCWQSESSTVSFCDYGEGEAVPATVGRLQSPDGSIFIAPICHAGPLC
jgi:hypothetical protein